MPGVAWMINCYKMKRETTQAFAITQETIQIQTIQTIMAAVKCGKQVDSEKKTQVELTEMFNLQV